MDHRNALAGAPKIQKIYKIEMVILYYILFRPGSPEAARPTWFWGSNFCSAGGILALCSNFGIDEVICIDEVILDLAK